MQEEDDDEEELEGVEDHVVETPLRSQPSSGGINRAAVAGLVNDLNRRTGKIESAIQGNEIHT